MLDLAVGVIFSFDVYVAQNVYSVEDLGLPTKKGALSFLNIKGLFGESCGGSGREVGGGK